MANAALFKHLARSVQCRFQRRELGFPQRQALEHSSVVAEDRKADLLASTGQSEFDSALDVGKVVTIEDELKTKPWRPAAGATLGFSEHSHAFTTLFQVRKSDAGMILQVLLAVYSPNRDQERVETGGDDSRTDLLIQERSVRKAPHRHPELLESSYDIEEAWMQEWLAFAE